MHKQSRKVVMVGTSLQAPGGMTSVVKAYRDSGFFGQWHVTYLSSFERPGPVTQIRVMMRALSVFLRMLVLSEVALLHAHSASRGSFWRKSIFCAIARAFGVPYVFHVHSGEFPVFFRDECGAVARWWVRRTLRGARSVIALTSVWCTALEELAPGARVAVLGNPVAIPQDVSMRTQKAMHVLFLGRLREKKGVFDLIRAIPQVLQRIPGATFTLAGDGALDEAARLAQQLGVRQALNLPGWVDGEAKDALLASANVLVLPSYFEGLPVCILEAMAIGVPVVSTSVGGIPEVLENGLCGALVSPGDVGGLADAIIATLLDGDAIDRIRKRAFVRVKNCYSTPVILDALGELYRAQAPAREAA